MRSDKLGHCWKWRHCSGYAVCPFCGIERKCAPGGKKGGVVTLYRLVGGGDAWTRTASRCKKLLRIGGTHLMGHHGMLSIGGLYLAWPARFICFDADSPSVTVPVLAYWRARRAR